MAFAPVQPPLVAAGSSPVEGPKDASVYQPEDKSHRSDFRSHAIADQKPAITGKLVGIKRRSEFLAVAATGRRWVAPAFVLQVGPRACNETSTGEEIGLGFTATKRIGNAVKRNRAKRRLREAARTLAPDLATPGYSYVLIARPELLTCAFQTLLDDMRKAFSRVLTAKPRPDGGLRRSKRRSGTRSP